MILGSLGNQQKAGYRPLHFKGASQWQASLGKVFGTDEEGKWWVALPTPFPPHLSVCLSLHSL